MRTKYFAAGALLLLVGFLLGWGFQPAALDGPAARPATVNAGASATAKDTTVSVMLDFGDGEVRSFQKVDVAGAKTVFDLMKSLSESGNGFAFGYQPPGQYGTMVEQIGNKKNGQDGKYWMFWVNNALAEAAVDRVAVLSGQVIEWKFINLKGGGQ